MADTERERFERWAKSQEDAEPDETKRDDRGYKYSDVESGWKSWQASAQAQRERDAKIAEYYQGPAGYDAAFAQRIARAIREGK